MSFILFEFSENSSFVYAHYDTLNLIRFCYDSLFIAGILIFQTQCIRGWIP
jgi:hypothetical protein